MKKVFCLIICLGILFSTAFTNASELSEEQKCYERAIKGEKLISVCLKTEDEVIRCYQTMVARGYVPVNTYGYLDSTLMRKNFGGYEIDTMVADTGTYAKFTKTNFVLITFEKKYPARWE